MSSTGGSSAPRRNTIDIVRGGLAAPLPARASLSPLRHCLGADRAVEPGAAVHRHRAEGLAGLRADARAARGAFRPRYPGRGARRQRGRAGRGRLRGRAEAGAARALPRGHGARAEARAVRPAQRRRGLRAARAPDGGSGAAGRSADALAGRPRRCRCLCEGGRSASAIRRPAASARSRPRGSASSTGRGGSTCGSTATCSATATAAIPSSPASAAR